MKAYRADAAGNRFVLIDGIAGRTPSDPASLARRVCASSAQGDFHPDGLLLCLPGSGSSPVRMVIHNKDGSRPEACGNGLRIIALLAVQEGYAGGEFSVETDCGARMVRVVGDCVEVCLGPAVIEQEEHTVCISGIHFSGARVSVGNPHFVLFASNPNATPPIGAGMDLTTHPSFPQGTNVEFIEEVQRDMLRVRIIERGVGETKACGTGAAAAAFVAVERGLADWPVAVRLRGGDLVLNREGEDIWLGGTTRILGTC